MTLVCSLLLTFQTAIAAQSHLLTEAAAHPKAGVAPQLIAMANVTGTAERNGSPLLNGAIVSSGDLVSTRGHSAVLLASTPEERLWLGPDTSARLSKHGGDVSVALERGTVMFHTRGHIKVTLEQREGLALQSHAHSLAVAQLRLINKQQAQVRLQQGALELVQGGRSIPLQMGSSQTISATGTLLAAESPATRMSQSQSNAESNAGSVAGTVVDSKLFVVSGASVTLIGAFGSSYKTFTDPQGKFELKGVPAGTYTLHVVSKNLPTYEMVDVVVTAGKESSLYVQLKGNGGNNHALIIGLVAGGGAAAGIGVWAATKGKKSTSSPSVP